METEQIILYGMAFFFGGIILFVALVLIKDRHKTVRRHKTTSVSMARSVAEAAVLQPVPDEEGVSGGQPAPSGVALRGQPVGQPSAEEKGAAVKEDAVAEDGTAAKEYAAEDAAAAQDDHAVEKGAVAEDDTAAGEDVVVQDDPAIEKYAVAVSDTADGEDIVVQGDPAIEKYAVAGENVVAEEEAIDGEDVIAEDDGRLVMDNQDVYANACLDEDYTYPPITNQSAEVGHDSELEDAYSEGTFVPQAANMADMVDIYEEEKAAKAASSVHHIAPVAPVDNVHQSAQQSARQVKPAAHQPAPVSRQAELIDQPAPDAVPAAPEVSHIKSKRRNPEPPKLKERRVLLVEDVEANRELIAMFLEDTGVTIDFAENGQEACEKFEECPVAYSLILMDVHMPVMDGYEAARRIRSLDEDWAKQVPIVAMTADALKEDIDQCFDAGMDDYIPKPVDLDALQDKVSELVWVNIE
jgi:CheY-like chemotaxis protein